VVLVKKIFCKKSKKGEEKYYTSMFSVCSLAHGGRPTKLSHPRPSLTIYINFTFDTVADSLVYHSHTTKVIDANL
jgi:hypothetical protein